MRDSEPINSGDPSRADCENTDEFERVAENAALTPAERNAKLARSIVHAFLNLRSEDED